MPAESPARASATPSLWDGWQGILFIAATYVYFLIFAQFGFLERLAQLAIGPSSLPSIMGAMALGGIAMSLLAPRIRVWPCPNVRLQIAFIWCALAALWSLLPLNSVTAAGVALVIGLSLGLLTVTLVANLRLWTGNHRPLFKVGLGTGLAYFVCNFPPLFTAAPRSIATVSALTCVLGFIVATRTARLSPPPPAPEPLATRAGSFPLALIWFTALIWIDSAAFFVIQHAPALKAGAWQGNLHLWRTGILHFLAALVSAALLARRSLSTIIGLAMAALLSACLLVADPARVSTAAILYPIGVSLYSVALVAYPSLLMPSVSGDTRSRRAGYLYALAGWIGSALGIGMAANLHQIPPAFVALAASLFIITWLWDAIRAGRWSTSFEIQALAVVVVLALAFAGSLLVRPPTQPFTTLDAQTAVERGRRVYIAEGCMNCHSQYVRPHTADVAMWGPVTPIDTIRRQHPPLIGNRRQGPDLSQVGARRSPLWLRIHFMNPRDVSYNSPMPRFDYLFRDTRGDDLVAYLASLNTPGHWTEVQTWQLAPAAGEEKPAPDGARLFDQHCATCHSPSGVARLKWLSSFHRIPSDLARDAFKDIPDQAAPADTRAAFARITRFGIKATDMPGHEYLSDSQIAALTDYVLQQRAAQHR